MQALVRLAIALCVVVSQAADIKIAVGKGGLTFSPSSVSAAVGDTVIFSFLGGEHAVGQSSANAPCQPIDGSFYSGIVTGSNTGPESPTFSYKVTSKDPIYYYCPVGKHCQAGMVGIINPPTGNLSFASYSAKSQNATSNISPKAAPGYGGELRISESKGNTTTTVQNPTSTSANASEEVVTTITSTVPNTHPTGNLVAAESATSPSSAGQRVANMDWICLGTMIALVSTALLGGFLPCQI